MNKISIFILTQVLLSVELFAQSSSQGSTGVTEPLSFIGQLSQMIPMFVMVFMVFYFFVIKPQNKKLEDHRNLVSELKPGTPIIIGSGIHAKVTKVEEGFVQVEIAPKVIVKVEKDYISKAL